MANYKAIKYDLPATANFAGVTVNNLNIVSDETPQLGGNLDAQSFNITSLGTINTHTIPGGTGTLALTSDITFTASSTDTLTNKSGNISQWTNDSGYLTSETYTGTLSNVVEDTTPQLGGNLDGQSYNITTTGTVTGATLSSTNSSGSEGGEITLALAASGTTLTDGITIDVYGDKLRFFETGGTNRGAYIDLTSASSSAGTNLLAGGGGGLADVVDDTTPQLGGDLDLNSNDITGTGNIDITGDITATGDIDATVNGFEIGYRSIPQVSFTSNATLGLTDSGKHYYSTSASNLTLLIPTNSSVAFEVGASINIINLGTGTITVSPDTGVTLYFAGTPTTGSRDVSAYGAGTLQKVATDTWFLVGVGIV